MAHYGKRANKTVIYETIDNNVSLRGYSLQKKIPPTKLFMRRILNHYSRKERDIASSCCDIIIVNSKSLAEYFGPESRLIYYYSPFEKISVLNDGKNKPALIYLGEFSEEKGALEILAVRKELDMKLFIFGSAASDYLKDVIQTTASIYHTPKIPQNELADRISALLGEYFLAGCSFIRPVHQSYATQEANKDIDYLALGIPLIGNHRIPTEEKILAGCGIFAENDNELKKLISDDNFRSMLSKKCKEYYFNNYSKRIFRNKLDEIFTNYVK